MYRFIISFYVDVCSPHPGNSLFLSLCVISSRISLCATHENNAGEAGGLLTVYNFHSKDLCVAHQWQRGSICQWGRGESEKGNWKHAAQAVDYFSPGADEKRKLGYGFVFHAEESFLKKWRPRKSTVWERRLLAAAAAESIHHHLARGCSLAAGTRLARKERKHELVLAAPGSHQPAVECSRKTRGSTC